MARKPRIEFEGAFYHVIVRGNQRQKIFKDKYDFLKYLEILGRYKRRYQYLIYCYVLMNNHVHLLVEVGKTPLSKILQGINQGYTMYFNRKYKTVGHLFQGRYKAILCDRDEYLLSLIKYIHLNPVRAKVAKTPDEYRWSSHHNYTLKTEKDSLIDTEQILRMFSEDKANAKKLYKVYMSDESVVTKEDIYSTVDQGILGNEKFIEEVKEKYDRELAQERRIKEYKLNEIAKGVEKACEITLKQIRQKSKSREVSLGRKLISLVASEYGYKGKEIAEFMQKDPAVITRHLREREDLVDEIRNVIASLRKDRENVNNQV